jgi:hypothetical protein
MVHFVKLIELLLISLTTLSQVKASFSSRLHHHVVVLHFHLIILSSSSLKTEDQSVIILYLPQDPSDSFRTSRQLQLQLLQERLRRRMNLHSFIHSNRRKNPPPMICCEELSLRERNICHSSREMFPHFDHKSLGLGSITGRPHVSHHQSSWIYTAANMQIRGLSLEESLLFYCPLELLLCHSIFSSSI